MKTLDKDNGVTTIQAKVVDKDAVECLDAANWIRFGLTGDGELIGDLGPTSGSRLVQLYNGRATIRIKTNN